MEIRFINTWNAPLDLLRESLCVKTAILIGNKVMLAGEPAHNISIEKEYPKLSMMEKISYVVVHYKRDDKEEDIKEFELLKKIYQTSATTKHKSNDMFIKLKQIEAKFNTLYKATIKIDRQYADKTLYEGLSELIESENIQTKLLEFSCRGLYASKYSPQKEAKKILDFIFPNPNEAEPSILMMPSVYSINEKQAEQVSNEELSQEELEEIKQREERYAAEFNSKKPTEGKEYQRFITIPPLDYMAPSVFKLFRAQNQEILAEYNKYVNQWIHLWDKHTTDESVMKDISEMEEKICGLQVRIEKELQENELFRMSIANLNYDAHRATKIALSKIKISDLWELYETHKVFEKETIDALKSMASSHVHYKNNIPVIICFPFIWQTDEMEEREKKAETISIPVSKKSISID